MFGRNSGRWSTVSFVLGGAGPASCSAGFTGAFGPACSTSAGVGAVVHDEHVTGRIKFPYRWLSHRSLRPAICRIIRVTGESMEPTLPDGCAILIDLASKNQKDGKIFGIRIGDELVVKRTVLDPDAGGWSSATTGTREFGTQWTHGVVRGTM